MNILKRLSINVYDKQWRETGKMVTDVNFIRHLYFYIINYSPRRKGKYRSTDNTKIMKK